MTASSFSDCVIAVSGTFPGYKQADVKKLIEDAGATFTSSVNDKCTHLISTEKDVEKKSLKYTAASARDDVDIVSIEWLLQSVTAGKPVAEKAFLFEDHSNGHGQTGDGQNGSGSSGLDGTVDDTTDSTKDVKSSTKDGTASAKDAKTGANGKGTTGKKRSLEQVDGTVEDSNKNARKVKRTTSTAMNIPVDPVFLAEFGRFSQPKVYVDNTGLIWDATLNQTVASANNNKFYVIQVLACSDGEWVTWTRWGRVGERGQSAAVTDSSLDTCLKMFQRKFKDKSGLHWTDRLNTPKAGKYTFLERNYEDDEEEEEDIQNELKKEKKEMESALSKPLQDLISFIFNPDHFISAMASMSYDAKKLPLGKLSDRTLKTGFSVLKELSEMIMDPSLAQSRYDTAYDLALENLSNRYFTTIPHIFGRNRPPVLATNEQIKKEIELLEALMDMDVANEIMKDAREAEEINQLDRQFQSLGMEEMTRLSHSSEEFIELANYLCNSRGTTHHLDYKVIDIFRIARKGESERFESSEFSKLKSSDRRLLWHGSRSTNFGGILSQGLRIAPPEAPVNGYMFGKGVYLADASSKSANYCCPYSSANMGLLLLCDVELGNPMLELYDSDYMAGDNAKNQGKIATLGQGRSVPGGWKDAECLHSSLKGVKMPDVGTGTKQGDKQAWLQYNEYIVYDVAQIRQRYLFYVHMC